jgi:hypothetical protein
VNTRSVDTEQIRATSNIDPKGCVVLVALERQARILEAVSHQGESSEAAKPPELLPPTEGYECFRADDLYSRDAHLPAIVLPVMGRAVPWTERPY